jgi:lipid-A-disaccharide synthase
MNKPLHIYLIAGESSGDKLAAGMMRELKALNENIEFSGIGGPEMQAEGLTSLFPYNELALMGFAEILPKLFQLMGRIGLTVEDIQNKRPDMLITVDSPGFNFRVVTKLKEQNFNTKYVHAVAPTVWAYKPERAKKCAALFDHMLVLLPFEPPYFEREGLKTTYIGHPSVWHGVAKGDGAAFRARHKIDQNTKVIALLPGSRENEIKRHMWLMSQVINEITIKHRQAPIIVSAAPEHVRVVMTEYFSSSPFRNILVFDAREKMDALAAANVALVKSGTVTLEVAHAGTPMVVMYRVNQITAWIVRRLIKIPQVSLINILQNQAVMPEFLQENATVKNLSAALEALIESPTQQQFQRTQFAEAIAKMQPSEPLSPYQIAAREMMTILRK